MNNMKNIKIFPIYKLFSYDLMFYYAISMLFLTKVKHISVSDILLLSSIYCAFQLIFQIPVTLVVDKVGYKKCIIIGNVLCTTAVLTYIIAPSFGVLMLGDLQLALGFALKSVSESPFIFTIMKREGLKDEVSKVEAKGSSLYFYFEAFASVLAGYLFDVNVYLPFILCALCMLTATIISFYFDDSSIIKNKIETSFKDTISDMKNGFKFIFHSERLKAVLLYSCIFAGVVSIAANFSKAYLTDLEISPSIFGIIFAGLNIISAIGSSLQDKYESKRKKKTLSYIAVTYTSAFIFIGLTYIIGFNVPILLTVALFCFTLQNFFKGGYRVLMKKYLNNFTSSSIRSKIMSIYYLVEMFGTTVLLFLASRALNVVNIGVAYIISGVLLLLIMVCTLDYMRTRLGLKPEEYKEKDITYKS